MKEELLWVCSLTRVAQGDKKRLVALHRELFGVSLDFCTECPEEVRNAVRRIKQYEKNTRQT